MNKLKNSQSQYIPDEKILKKYADVLIKYALWWGKWIKKGEVVYLAVPEIAKPILIHLQTAVIEAWWHFITDFIPDGVARNFYEKASPEQIEFLPKNYLLERIKTCDHFLRIDWEFDKNELSWIPSSKIMTRQKMMKFYMEARDKKENAGKLTWTIWTYGTEAMAKDAQMTLEEYWKQIIQACFLNHPNPIQKWKNISKKTDEIKKKIDKLLIDKVFIKWEDVDLEIKIWEHRKWLGGSGRNIPSFEIFTSPDWRGTNWKAKFNQPLSRYWNIIEWIELEFKDWVVIKSKAQKNEKLLKEILKTENADKIWEFSLTDKRFSNITRYMWDTMYDENMWWEFGNFHIAIWKSYEDTFDWNIKTLNNKKKRQLWFNDCAIHIDIVSTTNRTVTAMLQNWEKKVIYKNGEFKI